MNNMDSIVKDGIKNGAELLTGGERIGNKGYFYKPLKFRGNKFEYE
jgi:succinate-semialdehyde dehydrogenase / glutarate-semialdehyde dehydrogenase